MKKLPTVNDGDILNEITFEPLSKKTWPLFVRLFGARGACGNCWCMYFRLKKDDFVQGKENE